MVFCRVELKTVVQVCDATMYNDYSNDWPKMFFSPLYSIRHYHDAFAIASSYNLTDDSEITTLKISFG